MRRPMVVSRKRFMGGPPNAKKEPEGSLWLLGYVTRLVAAETPNLGLQVSDLVPVITGAHLALCHVIYLRWLALGLLKLGVAHSTRHSTKN